MSAFLATTQPTFRCSISSATTTKSSRRLDDSFLWHKLPNELLSSIVSEALLSHRLSPTTDELFIQPKCKISFSVLSRGFGLASRKFRAILFREWFRVFHAHEMEDIRRLIGEIPGGIKSVNITGFVRELYLHQPINLLPYHFIFLQNLYVVSFPLYDNYTPRPRNSGLEDRGSTPYLPQTIQALELREALNCSPEELRSAGIAHFIGLTSLKVTCGFGAWSPIPEYGREEMTSGIKKLASAYVEVLSPLKQLCNISFDIHLTDTSTSHPQVDPTQVTTPVLVPLLGIPLAAPPPATRPCTGNNLCSSCWDARRSSSEQREIYVSRSLAKVLPRLETVEWTIWYREAGQSEEKRRVHINRNLVHSNTVEDMSTLDSSQIQDYDAQSSTSDLTIDDEIVCTTTKVPLALYPAILG